MQKQSIWESPPSYGGARDNKSALKRLSSMCMGLSAMAFADNPSAARRLESIGTLIGVKVFIAGRRAFIFANVIDIYEDLTSLRAALGDSGNATEVEHYLNALTADVKVLGTFLEHEIEDSPMEANMNRAIRKFIVKKSAVEAIARATEGSLVEAEKKLKRLQLTVPQTEREKQRRDHKIANLKSFIWARQSAADTLSSIVDRLNELEDTARLSPGLSRRLNRLIRLKPLADFYDKPERAKKEREALYLHLQYINGNQNEANAHTHKLDNFLNQGLNGASSEPALEPQSVLTEESAPEMVSDQQSETKKSQKQKNFYGGNL